MPSHPTHPSRSEPLLARVDREHWPVVLPAAPVGMYHVRHKGTGDSCHIVPQFAGVMGVGFPRFNRLTGGILIDHHERGDLSD